MKPTVAGIDALNHYLKGEWDFDQLYDWAITFSDTAERRSDEQSAAIAWHVLAWIFEMIDGLHTQEEFDAEVASLACKPQEVIARAS
jgi:hypothetical protein